MAINSVTLGGRLTSDPQLKTTPGGTSMLMFSIAVNERRRDQQGEWADYPGFYDCVMFGSRTPSVAQYLYKGAKVSVQGKLHWSSWEKDGQRRSKVEIYVDEIDFMFQQERRVSAPQTAPTYSAPQQAPQQYSAPAQQYAAPAPQPGLYQEDIPF